MEAVFSASLLVATLAPLLEVRLWGVPFRYVPLARLGRTFLTTLFITGVAGGVALLALEQADAPPATTSLAAALVALAFGTLLAVSRARRDRALRGLHILCAQLAMPFHREDAGGRVDQALTRALTRSPREHALLTLFAAGSLTRHGFAEVARKHLLAADEALPEPPQRALRQQLEAMAFLHEGKLEDAEARLNTAPSPTTPEVDAWVDATKALCHVVSGGVEAALGLIESEASVALAAADPALFLQHQTVRAHALACQGEDDQASAALAELLARSGPAALSLALRPVGPATDLARALLASHTVAT